MTTQTINIDIPCPHGEQCKWFPALRQFVNFDFVPSVICEMCWVVHNTFMKRTESSLTVRNFIGELARFHECHTAGDKKKYNQLHTIKMKAIRAFRILHCEENGKDKTDEVEHFLKQVLDEIQNLLTIMSDSSKKDRNKFNQIMSGIKESDEPITFRPREERRRQRDENNQDQTMDWFEDVEPDKKIIIESQKKYTLDRNNLGKHMHCNHCRCKWVEVWEVIQNICGVFISTSVPMQFCETLRKTSITLMENNAVTVVDNDE
jgi:hypothetical protein